MKKGIGSLTKLIGEAENRREEGRKVGSNSEASLVGVRDIL